MRVKTYELEEYFWVIRSKMATRYMMLKILVSKIDT